MKMVNKNNFLQRSAKTLGEIFDMLIELPELTLKDLENQHTALIIVDMINGFAIALELKH
jgi:hypothetical protein